jgi:hypothetical protein
MPHQPNTVSDLKCVESPIILVQKTESETKSQRSSVLSDEIQIKHTQNHSDRKRQIGRFVVFLIGIAFLIIGRAGVPNIEVSCVEDKVLEALEFANNFINKEGNQAFRDAFQALCSFLVDFTFAITFGYWVLKGKSTRLPLTLAIFYITRALVQKLWFSPFPNGFYWEDPGVPSLVVPYGRGSDFFFSGHSGFMIICAKEWGKAGKTKIRNFVMLAAGYTMLILLVYRIHYSIDVFTGVFFADWCFEKVEKNREQIDALWGKIIEGVKRVFERLVGNKKIEKKELINV